jgi:hypothetical protein
MIIVILMGTPLPAVKHHHDNSNLNGDSSPCSKTSSYDNSNLNGGLLSLQ